MSQKVKFTILLGASVLVSLLLLMFAFIQQAEAKKQFERAYRQERILLEERMKYEQLQHEYMLTTKTLEDCIRQSEELKMKAGGKSK